MVGALGALMQREPALNVAWLHRVIDAREAALDTRQPGQMHSVEKYSEETASSLLYLLLNCTPEQGGQPVMDINADVAVCRAASHVGTAIGPSRPRHPCFFRVPLCATGPHSWQAKGQSRVPGLSVGYGGGKGGGG